MLIVALRCLSCTRTASEPADLVSGCRQRRAVCVLWREQGQVFILSHETGVVICCFIKFVGRFLLSSSFARFIDNYSLSAFHTCGPLPDSLRKRDPIPTPSTAGAATRASTNHMQYASGNERFLLHSFESSWFMSQLHIISTLL